MLRIREILKEKNIAQIELAGMLGISKSGLQQNIDGNPSIGTLKKIADAIGCSVYDLFENPNSSSFRCPNCNHELKVS